jgi:hypothetical protein
MYMYVYMCMCMYIYVYMYVYIYMYIYIIWQLVGTVPAGVPAGAINPRVAGVGTGLTLISRVRICNLYTRGF